MPDNVYFDQEAGIIRVDSAGDVKQEDMLHSLQKVLEMAEETGSNKVLVNTVKQTSLPPVMELHQFGSELSNKAFKIKHAIVVSKETLSDNFFIETVSRNRGVNMMIFDCEKSAAKWLSGQN